jgi:hypothetical protein
VRAMTMRGRLIGAVAVTIGAFGVSLSSGSARATPAAPAPPTTIALPASTDRQLTEAYTGPAWTFDPVSALADETIIGGTTTWRVTRTQGKTMVSRSGAAAVTIGGYWGVGVVTARGHRSGASADGTTLVLGNAVNHGWFVAVRDGQARKLGFNGTFALDAVANNGSALFLIETKNTADNLYVVRKADLTTGRLAPDPLLNTDVNEAGRVSREGPETTMRGASIDRLIGPDGWTYTLYFGDGHAYVHALDTKSTGAGLCFDLPQRWNDRTEKLRLAIRNSDVGVTGGTSLLARLIGTRPGSTPRIDLGTPAP